MTSQQIQSEYLVLVKNFLDIPFDESALDCIDAIEAFEEKHPTVGDDVYKANGPYEMDLLTGNIHKKVA